MKTLRKIWVLPTWLLVNLMTPILPKQHIWKNRHFSLSDWSRNATNLTFGLSLCFWYFFVMIFVFLILKNK